jgi:hypothetical protein
MSEIEFRCRKVDIIDPENEIVPKIEKIYTNEDNVIYDSKKAKKKLPDTPINQGKSITIGCLIIFIILIFCFIPYVTRSNNNTKNSNIIRNIGILFLGILVFVAILMVLLIM